MKNFNRQLSLKLDRAIVGAESARTLRERKRWHKRKARLEKRIPSNRNRASEQAMELYKPSPRGNSKTEAHDA